MRTLDDPIEHIRTHPDLYLPGGRPQAASLAARLAEEALLLGATRVDVCRDGEWWWVAADRDWIGETAGRADDVFSRIVAFPKAGVNAMRSEVLLSAFAEEVVTRSSGRPHVIKGNGLTLGSIARVPCGDGAWRRNVGFRMVVAQESMPASVGE